MSVSNKSCDLREWALKGSETGRPGQHVGTETSD